MLKFGTVSHIDSEKARARVKFDDADGMISYWLPILKKKTLQDKQYWMLDIDEHVAVIMDENSEEGIILGSIYSDADLPPVNDADKCHVKFKDGSFVEYDRKNHVLTAHSKGDIVVKSDTHITVTAPAITAYCEEDGTVLNGEYTGNLHIIGNLQVDGQITNNGNLQVNGNIDATGTIIDVGGNTNHHGH